MSKPIISVQSVSKAYTLGTGSSNLLAERMGRALSWPAAKLRRGNGSAPAITSPGTSEQFWALKDVSLGVEKGEVVGLIGPNGAGKSTLFKVLSRITPPTEGRIELGGRVATLLEVGTGFHPELTGRENIYLNGTILGMRRREIDRHFDAIVDFSGIERFIDTPVKRYSSGMYVRLAFAVAAHLEPEILLVDEVLAVGDAEFQRKCVGKMQEVSRDEGRTIVFVSHNMSAIRRLCTRAYYVDGGRIAVEGPSDEVVSAYLGRAQSVQEGGEAEISVDAERVGTGQARLTGLALLNEEGQPTTQLRFREPVRLTLRFDVAEAIEDACLQVGISAGDGRRIVTAHNIDGDRPPARLERGSHAIHAELTPTLLPGEFTIDVQVADTAGVTLDYVERTLDFSVLNVPADDGDHYPWTTVLGGVRCESSWTSVPEPAEPAPRRG